MVYNEKELQAKLEKEKETIVLPSKKESVGDILKNKRLETGKTVEEISDYLRIKSQYLFALEENKFNNLPGSAYVIGFIKSYASYLGLDANSVIIQYKQEIGAFDQNSQNLIEDENTLIKDPVITSNHIIIAGVVVFFGIIFVSFISSKKSETPVISSETQENIEEVAENTEISMQNTNLSSDKDLVETEEVLKPSDTNINLNFSKPEYFETKIEGVNLVDDNPSVDAKKSPEKTEDSNTVSNIEADSKKTSNTSDTVVTEETATKEHIAKEYGLENKENSEIYVKANKKVWIKLKKDGLYKYDSEQGDIGSGNTVFETILDNGDTYYVPQGENYYLTIGNALGVEIYADGEKIAPLSKKEVSRHNIEMNVEKLKNGTAYVKNRVIE